MIVILTSAILSTAASLARAQLQEVEPPQFGVRTLQVREKLNKQCNLKMFPVTQKYFHKNIQSLKNCLCRMKKPVFKNISIQIFSAI